MPADRPIKHNGDVAEYLRQLGVKDVTAQDVDPLLTSSLVAGDATRIGPQFTEKIRAHVGTEGAIVGAHGVFLIEGGPGGSYLDSGRTTQGVGVSLWALLERGALPPLAGPVTPVAPAWSTGYRGRPVPTIRRSIILTAQLPTGLSTMGNVNDTIFPEVKDGRRPLQIPPGVTLLVWNNTANVAYPGQFLIRDV